MKRSLKVRGFESWLRDKKRVLVCLSGGVDSCALTVYCADILGADNTVAFIGTAPYIIDSEIKFAVDLCKKLGVKFIKEDVSVDEIMQSNPPSRCFLCKRNIFMKAREKADEAGVESVFDGTNYDDLGESRPGSAAKTEFDIESPFAKFCVVKSEVRKLLSYYGFAEIAGKPSATCFMTRLPTGARAKLSDFKIIKKTEDFLRQLGFDFSRARKYPDRIEIQVPRARVPELLQEQNAKKLGDFFAKNKVKNFEISREGYRHGCM